MRARWRTRKTFNFQQFHTKRKLFKGNDKNVLLNVIIFFLNSRRKLNECGKC